MNFDDTIDGETGIGIWDTTAMIDTTTSYTMSAASGKKHKK